MPKGFRDRKKPSRRELEDENERLRDALEEIADILEDVGFVAPADDEESIDGEDEKIENPIMVEEDQK